MMTDAELDRVLTTWLVDGPNRAPQRYVDAAIAESGSVRQRRPLWPGRPSLRLRPSRPLLAMALIIALLAAGLAIGVGSRLLRPPTDPPTPRPAPFGVPLKPLQIADWPVRLSIPTTWSEVEGACCDYRHFEGTSPAGVVSVGHESPFSTGICSPECRELTVPITIPYSAEKQLDALKAGVAAIAGSAAWTALPPDVLPQVEGASRLDTTGSDASGAAWRRVHIVGLRERNLVAVAWSQPADQFDEALLDSVLAGIELTGAPEYSDGDLMQWDQVGAFTMPMPGIWSASEQPTLDGAPLAGVWRFADGRVVVSIGDTTGAIGWCDPDCRQLTDQRSLDTLVRSLRSGQHFAPAMPTTLGGEPALVMASDEPVVRRVVAAMHRGHPVAVLVDAGEWDVAPGIADRMIAGFAFAEPEGLEVDQIFTIAGGMVEMGLPREWTPSPTDDGSFRIGAGWKLAIRAGTDDGAILTCETPAGPWEICREVRVATVDELAEAVQPAPIQDHGVGPPVGVVTRGTLDGEPATIVRIQAYEYPAQSGQEVAYVVAFHTGRPFLVRVWTSDNSLGDIEGLLAGFRFVE